MWASKEDMEGLHFMIGAREALQKYRKRGDA